MSQIIFFDTETTGFIKYGSRSDHPDQPHLVQLAAVLYDLELKKVVQSIDLIVKPEGWEIPEAATNVHGISTEYASEVGISEEGVIGTFIEFCHKQKRVAYNTPFDKRIIRIAVKRYLPTLVDMWNDAEYDCAMKQAREVIGGKNCKLAEAYHYFTGEKLENAHTAMADTLACMEVYLGATK